MAGTRKSDDGTFAPLSCRRGGLPSIIYGDVSHEGATRIVESNCVYGGLKYGRDSEKRRAASFFCRLFSPVSTSSRLSAFPDKREKRSYAPLGPLFDWIFARKERKTTCRTSSPVLCLNMYYHSRAPPRQGAHNDRYIGVTILDGNVDSHSN